MSRPLPPLVGPPDLENYVHFGAHGATLQVPARDFRAQGLAVLVLLPVLSMLIGLLVVAMTSGNLGLVVGAAVAAGGSLLSVMGGVVMLIRAPGKSADSQVLIHTDRRVVGQGVAVGPGELVSLRVGQPQPMLKWLGVIGKRSDGSEVVLLGRLPPGRGRTIAALGEWLGSAFGVPVDTRVARSGTGRKPEHAAAMCYVPVQGIGFMYSVYTLFVSDDPLVRFSAKQSLSFQLLTGGATFAVVGGAIGAAMAGQRLGVEPAAAGAVFVLAAGFAVLFALLRLAFMIIAAIKALSGKAWPMPVFSILSRRWLTPELEAPRA
ncbi:MAG: DUF4870 domain-containing protein [Alphaproteobacteria bacterium]|nr:DUF4870 domain-containing protein [Alphaproteobacteria bacterium]